MYSYREDNYNIYTNYKDKYMWEKQKIFLNKEERLLP